MRRFRFNYLKFFIPLGVLLGLTIYYNTSYYIRNHEWKHSQYDSLGDWIEFTNPFYYDLQWRTIYKQHTPRDSIDLLSETCCLKYNQRDYVYSSSSSS
ncbi:hypothetical protein [Chitinophaga deserti]|uniref:hypothetical protein n=1 Tax=Chitinophaga deserti TaxID=2164099 RepID=UPI000D6AAE3B|nr:hypothetical protein [Chitinophaga deserti]